MYVCLCVCVRNCVLKVVVHAWCLHVKYLCLRVWVCSRMNDVCVWTFVPCMDACVCMREHMRVSFPTEQQRYLVWRCVCFCVCISVCGCVSLYMWLCVFVCVSVCVCVCVCDSYAQLHESVGEIVWAERGRVFALRVINNSWGGLGEGWGGSGRWRICDRAEQGGQGKREERHRKEREERSSSIHFLDFELSFAV